MRVTVTVPGSPPIAGTVTVTATATPPSQANTITQVEFFVDGVFVARDTSSPYTFSWDTTVLDDGQHTVQARAFYPRNKISGGVLEIDVLNTPEPPPPPPPPQAVPVNTVVPSINDTTPQVGQTIFSSTGNWTNEPDHYTYQWLRCDGSGASCVAIPGAVASSYTCVTEDEAATLRSSVTAHNNVGASAVARSAQTDAVSALAPGVPINVAQPQISGAAQQGNTLNASNGSWTNSPTSYTRQWKRCEPSVVTSSINNGDTILNNQVWTVTTNPAATLVEFYADGNQIGTDTVSPFQHTITGLSNGAHILGIAVTIGGVRTIISESGTLGTFANVTVAAANPVYNGAGTSIPGATASTYTIVAADVGKQLRVLTTAVNGTGSSIPVQSEPTATATSVAPPPPAPNAYWDENWEGGVVPANWLTERNTFGNGDVAKITYDFVSDPLSVNGTVLRLKCAHDATKAAAGTSYPSTSRQLVSLYRGAGQSRSGYQTINEETWYRVKFMFPTGNVFSDGESNFVVEWHTDNNTQSQGGNSPALLCGYGYPLTADGTTSPLGLFLRWNAGNPAAMTETYWPSSDGSGSFNAKTPVAFQANHWYDCKVRVIWSTNPAIGRVEWWMDGVQKLARSMATQYTNPNNFNSQSYHNFGLYNYRYNVTGDSSFYFDRCVAGPSEASIGG